MAELTTLARPYASAAFDLAKGSDRLDEWSRTLNTLAQASQTNEVQELIAAPTFSIAQRAHLFTSFFEDGELNEDMRRFVMVLAENGRLALLTEIAVLFENRRAEESRSLDVTLTTAVEITAEEREQFLSALTKRFEREISLTTAVDLTLIGGALVRAGDTVVDGTVRGKLDKMREALRRT